MNVSTAVQIINEVLIYPGWTFEASDHTDRFEASVMVKVNYQAVNTNRDNALKGFPESITTWAKFAIQVDRCVSLEDVARLILEDCIMEILAHEAREGLRVLPTGWAPFHPHKIGGMERMGKAKTDFTFGVG